MSNRAFSVLCDRFARIASTAKTTFADDDLEFIHSIRHCPSRDVLIEELRKSVDGPMPIIKHAMSCRHCAFELAMNITALDSCGKSIFDAIASDEENHSPHHNSIAIGDVCTIRPEGWTRDDCVTVSADGNVCYHAPIDVVVITEPTDARAVLVAQVGHATRFANDSDVVIPGLSDCVIEAWNIYSMSLTDLVPTGTRVSNDCVARVLEWAGSGCSYPLPADEAGQQYKRMEIDARNFFFSRCCARNRDRRKAAKDRS